MTCDEARIMLHALLDGEPRCRPRARGRSPYRRLPRLCRGTGRTARDAARACRHQFALRRAGVLAQPDRSLAAEAAAPAEPSLRAARLCDGLGGLRTRRNGRRRIGAAPGRPAAHPVGGRLRASAFVAGRSPHRRGLDRPAHREALVQRQARRRPARDRPHRARLYAGRRPARLYRRARHRRGRLQATPARDQFVRGTDVEHRAPAAEDPDHAGLQLPPLGRARPELLGRQRHRRRRASPSSSTSSRRR